jgi:shikimate dehydrogenase
MSILPIPRACVMGHPVAHSRSPMIHGYWLATTGIAGAYDLQDVAPGLFPDFVTHLTAHGYVGGNVTVPHKEAAFRLVARRDAVAEATGAVNTLWMEQGELVGGNSDVHGFVSNLDDRVPAWDTWCRRAVVLGAGGAARAAAHGLIDRGVDVVLVNRTLERAQHVAAQFGPHVGATGFWDLAQLLPTADLLVNCTSLGMHGKPLLDVDLHMLKPDAIVTDAVYVPLETDLLAQARMRGHRVVDGLGMLLHQAVYGFHKWFGVTPTVTGELRALVENDIRTKTVRS